MQKFINRSIIERVNKKIGFKNEKKKENLNNKIRY
jgi:hypothetical protein